MKIKLLTTIIAGVLLAGCGSDNDNDAGGDKDKGKPSVVLAFDGAINGMVATYTCADGTSGTTTTKTEKSQNVKPMR